MTWHRHLHIFKLLFVLVCLLSAQKSYADHLKGGWMKYTYTGKTGSTLNYKISFYQYSDCDQAEKVDAGIYLAVFAGNSTSSLMVKYVAETSLSKESKSDFGPCFQNPPDVCYLVAVYTTTIGVPENESGYVLTVQRCCRISGIENVPSSNTVGLTYTLSIPGGSNSEDNSPVFSFNDASAICVSSPFSFDFSAEDIDGDSLVYSLCSGLTGGTELEPVVEDPPAPPYSSISYTSPYSGSQPLGSAASIDPATGIFSGTAPATTGTYVAAVCIDEYRNGVYIGHTRKELHLEVSNCKTGGARLDSSYISCDGFDFTFVNGAGTSADYTYFWDFGVTTLTTDTSSEAQPTYTYPDTGVYTVKLKAQNTAGCEDSAETEVKIYPGFATDFSIDGSCIFNPYNFTDLTTTKYGYVDSWKWYFGETGTLDDTIQNPVYNYTDTGQKTITLISTSSKGCIDTATKALDVSTGPDVSLGFRDTLICSIDTLRLNASSTTAGATFSWLPAYNIIDANTANPYVYPKQTTVYNLTVNYKGCEAEDSVTVNVIDKVLLELPADTAICKTDSIQITPSTNALYFLWQPADGLSSDTTKAPMAAPLSSTQYTLTASVGKCTATDAMNVTVAPYPTADAGSDVSICYGNTTQLNASIEGSVFSWAPVSSLINPESLSPIAGPQSTTTYVLSVTDTIGCPKPVSDSVVVTVIPKVIADAGNDTVIVRQQPLQLNATGGTNYEWSPSSNLSNPFIANPVATFTDGPDTVTYSVKVSTPEGCYSYDSIKIYIFETGPEVFIPTAFTPNGDGVNDVYKITVAGMKQFSYLRIYNRWGQLLFNTGTPNKGWDGTYNGNKQPSGTYVYVVAATDYNNKPYFKKGTFVLIR
ncbi:T9SS type B sorting domain-containing protein [Parafilimonas sp.]|uniref:gliding motility-associated C-terminal domain-containing protein n=1 Tax=Parafilimonas sp. TaxID=1969739 RepID=UPI0039E5ED0D